MTSKEKIGDDSALLHVLISAEMQHQALFYRVRTGLGGLRKEQRNMEQKRPFRSLSPLGKGSCWDCVISRSTQEFL